MYIKGEISSDLPYKKGHARFTTKPNKPLPGQGGMCSDKNRVKMYCPRKRIHNFIFQTRTLFKSVQREFEGRANLRL